MAALPVIAAVASIASAGYSVASAAKAKKPTAPALPVTSAAPPPIDPTAITRAKATGTGAPSGMAATLLTGPAGLSKPATTQGKTLLGL